MKKNIFRYIYIFVFVVILCTSCGNSAKDAYAISYETIDPCTYDAKEIYMVGEQPLYAHCVKDLKIIINSEEHNLVTSLQNGLVTLEDIIDKMEPIDIYKDGGSKMYAARNYRILKCHTTEGNEDYILGDDKLKYEEDFCKTE